MVMYSSFNQMQKLEKTPKTAVNYTSYGIRA